MKSVVCLVVLATIALAMARPDEAKYTTKFDNIDIDAIITNDRLMKNYVDCLVKANKKCTPDGEELKRVLPDALATHCSKCNDKQKNGARKILRHLIKNKKEWFNQLEAKYDPNHVYRKEYDADLKKEGLTL